MIGIFGTLLGLPRWVQGLGLAAVAIAAFLAWDWLDDRAAVRAADHAREARAAEARDHAAEARVADAIANTKAEEELHHAIDTAPPGGTLSPAARALACERLRRIGRIPADCRPARGD